MYISPTRTTLTALWDDIKSNQYFILQKTREYESKLVKNLLGTLQNVFDTKQQPYRIVLVRTTPNGLDNAYIIATADSLKDIESNWLWIQDNLLTELDQLQDRSDKESFVLNKIQALASKLGGGSDSFVANFEESDKDTKLRQAARSWRKSFDIPESEYLINFYSAGFRRNGLQQGWMYISENYLAFYAFVLGTETRLFIELRDISELKKERSASGFLNDSIRIILKDKEQHFFSNLFHRDETYDLLESLCARAMTRILNSTTSSNPAPGKATTSSNISAKSMSPAPPALPTRTNTASSSQLLQNSIKSQRKNASFIAQFNIPVTEHVVTEAEVIFHMLGLPESYGKLYISETFICFASEKMDVQFAIPLFAIKRVERLAGKTQFEMKLQLETWHSTQLTVALFLDKPDLSAFCAQLRDNLRMHSTTVKQLPRFLETCSTEALLAGKKHPTPHGLGVDFGYPLATKTKDRNKLKAWLTYCRERGRHITIVRTPMFSRLVNIGVPNRIRGEIWELTSGAIYLRCTNVGVYQKLLSDNAGSTSFSLEEIEKDLNRSLPEYPAYQEEVGIDALRRVLTAYSWKDPGFFMDGPRVLFQIALAFLKLNAEAILKVTDDGMLLNVFKSYISSLDDPVGSSGKATKFDQLLFTAIRDFHAITTEMIIEARKSHQLKVVHGIENFKKRSVIRNLKDPSKFTRVQLDWLWESYSNVQFHGQQQGAQSESDINFLQFARLMGHITTWGRLSSAEFSASFSSQPGGSSSFSTSSTYSGSSSNSGSSVTRLGSGRSSNETPRPVTGSRLIEIIFQFFDSNQDNRVSFQEFVSGFGAIVFTDINGRMEWFFKVHDSDRDGVLTREDILLVSESLLFIFRNESAEDVHLSAVSTFLRVAFQMADILPAKPSGNLSQLISLSPELDDQNSNNKDQEEPLSMTIPGFRATLLADEVLEHLFQDGLVKTLVLVAPARAVSSGQETGVLDSLWKGGKKFGSAAFKETVKVAQKFSNEMVKEMEDRRRREGAAKNAAQVVKSDSEDDGCELVQVGGDSRLRRTQTDSSLGKSLIPPAPDLLSSSNTNQPGKLSGFAAAIRSRSSSPKRESEMFPLQSSNKERDTLQMLNDVDKFLDQLGLDEPETSNKGDLDTGIMNTQTNPGLLMKSSSSLSITSTDKQLSYNRYVDDIRSSNQDINDLVQEPLLSSPDESPGGIKSLSEKDELKKRLLD